jgi:hypothetical protein
MLLHEAIKLTAEMEDESFIRDERFINYLADMQAFSGAESVREVFKKLCAAKYMDDIYSLWERRFSINDSQIRNDLHRLAYSASQKYGYKQDNVLYCLENVAYALKMIPSISVVFTNSSSSAGDSDLIGYWDFTYKKDKTMQLTVSRDGFARASSGTRYNWKLSEDKVTFFIPDFVSYEGVLVGDTISGFATSSYNPLGWEWSAKRRSDGMTEDNLKSGEWTIVNDVQDLDDNDIRFLPDHILESKLYGEGRWYLNGNELEIFTANEFIKYVGTFVRGQVTGKGRNQMSNEWNFKLIKKE